MRLERLISPLMVVEMESHELIQEVKFLSRRFYNNQPDKQQHHQIDLVQCPFMYVTSNRVRLEHMIVKNELSISFMVILWLNNTATKARKTFTIRLID